MEGIIKILATGGHLYQENWQMSLSIHALEVDIITYEQARSCWSIQKFFLDY